MPELELWRYVDNKCEDVVKSGIGVRNIEWIVLAQDRERWRALVNVVMTLPVLQNAGNFLTSREQVSFKRRTVLHRVSE